MRYARLLAVIATVFKRSSSGELTPGAAEGARLMAFMNTGTVTAALRPRRLGADA